MTTMREAADETRAHPDQALGLHEGMIVEEIGWGPDVDELFRRRVQELTGSPLVDQGSASPVDVVLLWCRAAEGTQNLRQLLRHARAALSRSGFVWALTPTPGSPRRIHPVEIDTAAMRTGFHVVERPRIEVHRWVGVRLTWPAYRHGWHSGG